MYSRLFSVPGWRKNIGECVGLWSVGMDSEEENTGIFIGGHSGKYGVQN